jgi:hypothetical protein
MKIFCLLFYYLGDLCCRLGAYDLYNFFMSVSIDISDKNNLDVWKSVDKDTKDC